MRERAVEIGVAALIVGLLVVWGAGELNRQQQELSRFRSGSTLSNGESGARALYLWIDEMGLRPTRLDGRAFDPGEPGDVLWLLSPSRALAGDEIETLAAWVESGGTLIWAGPLTELALLDRLGLERGGRLAAARATPALPWLGREALRLRGTAWLEPGAGLLPLLVDDEGRMLAARARVGEGELWIFGSSEPFSNQGLLDPANGALVEALLAALPPGATQRFDEIHHGFGGRVAAERPALSTLLRSEPWGWGILFAAAVLTIWLLLRGRRFGRPIALPGEGRRREAGEYVRGMAWLFRRGRKRAEMARHVYERLRRELAERARLPPTTSDERLVSALVQRRDDLPARALLDHLAALRRPRLRERELLELARASEEWLERIRER